MNFRLLVLPVVLLGAVVGCQCGAPNLCVAVRCGTGLTCEPETGRCVVGDEDGGTGGGTGGGAGGGSASCSPACGGATPVCDPDSSSCKVCTVTEGCSGTAPFCDPTAQGGLGRCVACTATAGCSGATPYCDATLLPSGGCVACLVDGHCSLAGQVCEPATHTCVTGGTGGGMGGGTGGGSGGGTGGGSGGPTVVTFDDGGMSAHCLAGYTPPSGQACTSECSRGFECVGGVCVLRGQSGDVQVTLRFDQEEDLDLHVVEPLPNGGDCEIYYQNPGRAPDAGQTCTPPIGPIPAQCFPPPPPSKCGAQGWLDLDSYAACNPSNVMVENVIYPAGQPAPKGTYTVRVEYYKACAPNYPVPYEVEVRANGQRRFYCGTFGPNASHGGNAGAGDTVATFTIQ